MSEQFNEPTVAELRTMTQEYRRMSEDKKLTSPEYRRRCFIIAVALALYADKEDGVL
jgi:hypothetical protein